jgi:hypothetical protein
MTIRDICTDVQLQNGLRDAIHSSLKSLNLPEGLDASSLAGFLVRPFGNDSPGVFPLALVHHLNFIRDAVAAAVLVSLAHIDEVGDNHLSEVLADIESLLSVLVLMRPRGAEAGEVLQ